MNFAKIAKFEKHEEGVKRVINWAKSRGLDYEVEVDVSVGVADVLLYGDDIGIFEIGTTRPTKLLLLLKYIVRFERPYTVHLWPYATNKGICFQNWYLPKKREK